MKDYHCHILPEMDDGAKDVETSEKMLEMLFEQGVDAVVLTPHYYMSKESAESFLKRREKSFLELKKSNFNRIKYVLGAEVYLEKHISKIEYMEKLCFGSSKYILIEMPYSPIKDWMLKELDDIYYNLQLIPIFAHLDRYIKIYTKNDYKNLLQYDC
ncbi:MAG: CpsB/CapC family capsule biosynthesis tyrosine phosphatase, partial [Oscillospiraceae bacterium]